MSANPKPRFLEVWLHGRHIGWLCELGGTTRFLAAENYMLDSQRQTLSLSMTMPRAEWLSQKVLGNRFDPALYSERGELPPFFAGLLPEGPLRRRLAVTRCHGVDRDDFGILAAAGEDLPGAVKILPAEPARLTPMVRAYGVVGGIQGFEVGTVEGAAQSSASLAGMHNKLALSSTSDGKQFTLPIRGILSDTVAKLPMPDDDTHVMNEFVCMQLAALAGVGIARCRPESMLTMADQPDMIEAFGAKTRFLAIDRFDRGPNGALHIEDGCQLMTLMPARKYESRERFTDLAGLLNLLSSRGIEDVRQLFVRRVVNTLLGNSDDHLKNFSVIYRDGINPELAPAYDITCVPALRGFMGFAFNMAIDRMQRAETLETYGAMAKKAGVAERIVKVVVKNTVSRAQELWPDALRNLDAPAAVRDHILHRLGSLPVTKAR